MKSKHLITRILFSLFAIALLTTAAAAQTTRRPNLEDGQDQFRHGGSRSCRPAGHQLGHQGPAGRAPRHRREVFAEDH